MSNTSVTSRTLNDIASYLREDSILNQLSLDNIWINTLDVPNLLDLFDELQRASCRSFITSVRMPRNIQVAVGRDLYRQLLSQIASLPSIEEFVSCRDFDSLYSLARDSNPYIQLMSPSGRINVKRLHLQSGLAIVDAEVPSLVSIIEASESLEEFTADIETRFAHSAMSFIKAFAALPHLAKLSVTIPKTFCHQVWCVARLSHPPIVDDGLLACFLSRNSLQELCLYNSRFGNNMVLVVADALRNTSSNITRIELPGYFGDDLSKEPILLQALMGNYNILSLKLVSCSAQQSARQSRRLVLFQSKLDVLCQLNVAGRGRIIGDPSASSKDIIKLLNIARDHPDVLMTILSHTPRLFHQKCHTSKLWEGKERCTSIASCK